MTDLPSTTSPPSADTFLEQGYAVAPGVLAPDLLAELRDHCEQRLGSASAEHFGAFRFHGSMLPLDPLGESPVRRLVANREIRAALRQLGFDAPKWLSAYLISKPPRSPSLWWHQDWWAWGSRVSWEPWPAQLFAMYYLRDVEAEDGALRVIPGSHRRRHPLHDMLPSAHGGEIDRAPEDGPAHAHQPGEETVAVRAGDAVVGDARILHATHPNRSDRRRTCLTVWYLPRFAQLPDDVRSYAVDQPSLPPRGWWRQGSAPGVPTAMRDLLPTYDGDATPVRYDRTPPRAWPLRPANRMR